MNYCKNCFQLVALIFCFATTPSAYAHTSINDEDFYKLLTWLFAWLAVPFVSAFIAKKGSYFKTLLILFAAWLLHLFATAAFVDKAAFGEIRWELFWSASALLLASAMLIYRFETSVFAAQHKIRSIQISIYFFLTILSLYLLIMVVPLPSAKLFWTEAPSTWNDSLDRRHRVAMYLVATRQLVRKPASDAIKILGKPLIPLRVSDETDAINDQVSGLWERSDDVARDAQDKKNRLRPQERAEDSKALIYRLAVGKRGPTSYDPASYWGDPANDSVNIKWLRIIVSPNGMVTHTLIESKTFRVRDVARHLLN
jgi:hypothetical protein